MAITKDDKKGQVGYQAPPSQPKRKRAQSDAAYPDTDFGADLPSVSFVNGMVVGGPKKGESADKWARKKLQQAGLGSLADVFLRIVKNPDIPAADRWTAVRATPEYAKRFAGNVARQKAGLDMLSEGAYLDMEKGYRSALRQAGLPEGFYDDPSDFSDFIANDVSAAELSRRADMASQVVNSKDSNLLATFKDYYGLSKGDLTAWVLDPDRALPGLERKFQAASIGAEADRAGFDLGRKAANRLASEGIGQDAARAAYGDAARDKDALASLAVMDGVNLNPNKIAEANLGVNVNAAKKIRRLESRERGRFSGKTSGTAGLGGPAAGSF